MSSKNKARYVPFIDLCCIVLKSFVFSFFLIREVALD